MCNIYFEEVVSRQESVSHCESYFVRIITFSDTLEVPSSISTCVIIPSNCTNCHTCDKLSL